MNIHTMKRVVTIFLLLGGLAGCKKDEIKTNLLIRVENLTSLNLENVRIISYLEAEPFRIEKNYGDLDVSSVSDYQAHHIVRSTVEYIYRLYGAQMELSAWCGTGSTHLKNGKYTLHLRQDNNGNIYEEISKN